MVLILFPFVLVYGVLFCMDTNNTGRISDLYEMITAWYRRIPKAFRYYRMRGEFVLTQDEDNLYLALRQALGNSEFADRTLKMAVRDAVLRRGDLSEPNIDPVMQSLLIKLVQQSDWE